MCAEDDIAKAAASLRYLEPPRALDLEPTTFVIPVKDSEIAEPLPSRGHFHHLEGKSLLEYPA